MMHRDTTNEMDGLRFRFRATSLPKSPSAEHITSRHASDDDAQIDNNNNNEEDDDYSDDDVVLATYVEPPELPTKTTHKVFGAFLSLFFSRTRRDFCCCLSIIHKNNENDDVSPFRVCICIYIYDVTQ